MKCLILSLVFLVTASYGIEASNGTEVAVEKSKRDCYYCGYDCCAYDQCYSYQCYYDPYYEFNSYCYGPDYYTGSCDDGNPCTVGDYCDGSGNCVSGSDPCAGNGPCSNQCTPNGNSYVCSAPGGTSCSDGQFCNGEEYCDGAGNCITPGNPCGGGGVCNNQCNEGGRNCAVPRYTSCADSSWCNGEEYCDGSGNCVAGGSPCGGQCNDQCNEGARNCYVNAGTGCNNGAFCDGADHCDGYGNCVGSGNPCAGGGQCNNQCNEGGRNCYSNAGSSCDNGIWCDGSETCNGYGSCQSSGNPCASGGQCNNQCNEGARNCHSTAGILCDDGLYCTASSSCNGNGQCVGSGNPCSSNAECNNQCNEVARNCLTTAGTPCTADAYQCTTDTCNGQGVCTHATNEGASCNDGQTCTINDKCEGTQCIGSWNCPCQVDGDCNDGNPCTDDRCSSGSCIHPFNSATCNDGLWCNGQDSCANGLCSQHTGSPCGSTECANTCNEGAQNCYTPAGFACTDNTIYCDGIEKCDGQGRCASSGDPCATGGVCNNFCNETLKNCFSPASVTCPDSLFCNGEEKCDGTGNCISPGDPCVGGSTCASWCNETADACWTPAGFPCDDSLVCNGQDNCDGRGLCAHSGNPCENVTLCHSSCIESNSTNGTFECQLSLFGTPCGGSLGGDNGIFCDGIEICDGNGTCIGGSNPCLGTDCIDNPCIETEKRCNYGCSAEEINNQSSGMATGTLVGVTVGAVGGVLILAAIGVVGFFLWKRNYIRNNANGPRASIQLQEVDPNSPYRPIKGGNLTGKDRVGSTMFTINGDTAWEVPYEALQIEKEIGIGAFGVVYLGKWRGSAVAIKTLKESLDEKQLEDFKKEAAVMAQLRPHANVVQFLGVCTNPKSPLCLITEYMKRGSLYNYLRDHKLITDEVKMQWIRGIASGMYHLHSENIIHRDLAARNILLGDIESVAKISDFGMSRLNETKSTANQTKSDVGPLKHMAPECLLDRTYSNKSDVWAYGITVIEILSHEDPYPNLDPVQTATKVTHGLKHPLPNGVDADLGKLILDCFATDAVDRPDFEKICARLEGIEYVFNDGSKPKRHQTFNNYNNNTTQTQPKTLYGNTTNVGYESMNKNPSNTNSSNGVYGVVTNASTSNQSANTNTNTNYVGVPKGLINGNDSKGSLNYGTPTRASVNDNRGSVNPPNDSKGNVYGAVTPARASVTENNRGSTTPTANNSYGVVPKETKGGPKVQGGVPNRINPPPTNNANNSKGNVSSTYGSVTPASDPNAKGNYTSIPPTNKNTSILLEDDVTGEITKPNTNTPANYGRHSVNDTANNNRNSQPTRPTSPTTSKPNTTSPTPQVKGRSLPTVSLKPGDKCLAFWVEDNQWYDAIVNSVNGDQFTVTYLGYGNTHIISKSQVKPAPQ